MSVDQVFKQTELTDQEKQELMVLESIIEKDLHSFYEVGIALIRIRDERLYRETFSTFEEYLRRKWDIGRSRAYQLIRAAQVQDNLSTIVNVPERFNEAQLRPLASLPSDLQKLAWIRAVGKANGGKIKAEHTMQAAKEIIQMSNGESMEGLEQVHQKTSDDFEQGFHTFLGEIKKAKSEKWETTSREEAVRHVNLLRREISRSS